MTDTELNRYELLGGVLIVAAGMTLGISILGAFMVMTVQDPVPYLGLDDLQRQGRPLLALLAVGGGIAAASVLAALGAIVRLLVAARRDAAEPTSQ